MDARSAALMKNSDVVGLNRLPTVGKSSAMIRVRRLASARATRLPAELQLAHRRLDPGSGRRRDVLRAVHDEGHRRDRDAGAVGDLLHRGPWRLRVGSCLSRQPVWVSLPVCGQPASRQHRPADLRKKALYRLSALLFTFSPQGPPRRRRRWSRSRASPHASAQEKSYAMKHRFPLLVPSDPRPRRRGRRGRRHGPPRPVRLLRLRVRLVRRRLQDPHDRGLLRPPTTTPSTSSARRPSAPR